MALLLYENPYILDIAYTYNDWLLPRYTLYLELYGFAIIQIGWVDLGYIAKTRYIKL